MVGTKSQSSTSLDSEVNQSVSSYVSGIDKLVNKKRTHVDYNLSKQVVDLSTKTPLGHFVEATVKVGKYFFNINTEL